MSLFDDLLNPQKSQATTSTATTGNTSNGIIISTSEPVPLGSDPLTTLDHQAPATTAPSSDTPSHASPIIITESTPLIMSSTTPVAEAPVAPIAPSTTVSNNSSIIISDEVSMDPIVETAPVAPTESPVSTPIVSSTLLDMSQSESSSPSLLDMSNPTESSEETSLIDAGRDESITTPSESIMASAGESIPASPIVEHITPVDTKSFVEEALKGITAVRESIQARHDQEIAMAEEYRTQKEEYTTLESEALARAESIIEESKQAESIFRYLMEQLRVKSTGVAVDTSIVSEDSTPTPRKKTRTTVATTLTELGTREIVANTIDDTPVATRETVATAEESYSLI